MDAYNQSWFGRMRPRLVLLLILVALGLAGFIGWRLGSSDNTTNNQVATNSTEPNSQVAKTKDGVKSLVSYSLPDGWSDSDCLSPASTTYIVPNGPSVNCDDSPRAPIKAFIDEQSTTDCQQLEPGNAQNIKKHVCVSVFIDGHKSIKASTQYVAGTSYKIDTTVSTYYINTGRGVVAIEYTFTTANNFQAEFDKLAMGVKVIV